MRAFALGDYVEMAAAQIVLYSGDELVQRGMGETLPAGIPGASL
jgi:hypothetical protein